MKVYDRLMMELSNRQYLTEAQYKQFLIEEDLDPTETYVKTDMQKKLLYTVIDILEAVTNDMDNMTSISTEFTTVSEAYQYLEVKIAKIKDRIAAIPEPEEEYSAFSLMYTRGGSKTYGGFIKPINRAILDDILDEELGTSTTSSTDTTTSGGTD